MNIKHFFTALAMAVLISSNSGHASDMNVQALLQEYVDDNGAVGASVAVIDRGKVQFFSYGKKSIDGNDPISEDTIFEIGSITKVFTTLALMEMADQGVIHLDDPIEMYLPGVKIPELEGNRITLRHLATHTSGLPRMPDNFEPKNPANPYEDYTVERLYDYLSHCTLTKKPGESFEYSNVGMGLLGHILSIRSGQSYEELIHTLITRELEMPNTSISLTDEMSRNFATGHHLRQAVGYWDIPGLAGAGALRSNVKDMSRFLAANMALSQSPLTKVMQQCHEQQCTVAPDCAFGVGWVLSSSNHAELIWHNGGTGGFRTFVGFNPKTQKGAVILSNSTEDWPDELGVLLLNPAYKRPLINRALANDSEYMNQFVGSYEATLSEEPSKQDLQISVFGKRLLTQFPDGAVGMLYPESHGIFGVKGFGLVDRKVYFSFDPEGKISKVKVCLVSTETVLWEAIPRPLE